MNKSIFVAGGAGYIGSHIVRHITAFAYVGELNWACAGTIACERS